MLALLKLIPIKDYVYGLLFALILAALGYIYHKGEAHEIAKDTKVAVQAQAKVTAAQNTAQSTETQNALIYKQAVSIPAVGDLGIVCRAPSGGSLPAAVPGAAASASQPAANGGSGPTYDPSGALLTRAAEADAQIAYLQRRVHELEAEMNGAP